MSELIKECSKCKESKDISMFGKNKKTPSGYKYRCKVCETQMQKARRTKQKLEDPKKVKERHDKYYNKRKDHIREVQKQYMSKPEVREKRNEYIRKYKVTKRTDDKSYVLYENLRKRIWKCLKNKSNSSKELLGCDIDIYFKWIEFTMSEDMNWENYGKFWNIDHLIPLSTFDLTAEDEAKRAFNWKNTWAMKSSENFIKKNNIVEDQLAKHNEILNRFIALHNIESVISSQAPTKVDEGSETR